MRWIIRGIGVIVLIAVIAVVGVLMLPAERIAHIATEQLSRLTGRDVSVSGDVAMTFWPVLGECHYRGLSKQSGGRSMARLFLRTLPCRAAVSNGTANFPTER